MRFARINSTYIVTMHDEYNKHHVGLMHVNIIVLPGRIDAVIGWQQAFEALIHAALSRDFYV